MFGNKLIIIVIFNIIPSNSAGTISKFNLISRMKEILNQFPDQNSEREDLTEDLEKLKFVLKLIDGPAKAQQVQVGAAILDLMNNYRPVNTTEVVKSCPTPVNATIELFPPECCSFPFTLNKQIQYRCIQGSDGNFGCFIGRRIWVSCAEPIDYIARNKTVNISLPLGGSFITNSVNNWLTFQQRIDGSVNFARPWEDYKSGFGDYRGNFWLGLEKIHQMTKQGRYMLRIEMLYPDGKWVSAEYDTFLIQNETAKYVINVTGYYGDSGDVMNTYSQAGFIFNGMPFSTSDRVNNPNGVNYASSYGGGWWFQSSCCTYFLNGLYGTYFYGILATLSTSRMMMKRIDA